MGDLVNLRRTRKGKRRREKEEIAAANRLTHGQSRAERGKSDALKQKDRSRLEGHRREPPTSSNG
jgi:hypothetical protein